MARWSSLKVLVPLLAPANGDAPCDRNVSSAVCSAATNSFSSTTIDVSVVGERKTS